MTLGEPAGVDSALLHDEYNTGEMNRLKWSSSSLSEKRKNESKSPGGTNHPRVSGAPDELFALNDTPTRTSTFERKSVKIHEAEQRSRRRWYPILLLSIALNLFLLIGIFYIIYEAEYYNKDRDGYFLRACLIIFIPLLPVAVLLLWPFGGWWKRKRDAFSEEKASPSWRHVVNVLNALACFFFVLCFLFFSAIPKYNEPVWDTAVDFSGSIPVPAVAYSAILPFEGRPEGGPVFTDVNLVNDALNTTISGMPSLVKFYDNESYEVQELWGDKDPQVYRYTFNDSSRYDMVIDSIIANVSLTEWNLPPLSFILNGQAFISYSPVTNRNLTALSSVRTALEKISTSMTLSVFDRRFTVEEVALCSIVPSVLIEAYAINTLMMSVTQLSDPRKKMTRPDDMDPVCDRAYSLLETADPPIALYELSLTTSQSTNLNASQECRIDEGGSPAACTGGWQLMYGNQFITTQISRPGKSKQDIWIDMGAIVGAVQFFAWFLLVYFQE